MHACIALEYRTHQLQHRIEDSSNAQPGNYGLEHVSGSQ